MPATRPAELNADMDVIKSMVASGFFDKRRPPGQTWEEFMRVQPGTLKHNKHLVVRRMEEAVRRGIVAFVGSAMCREWVKPESAEAVKSAEMAEFKRRFFEWVLTDE